MRSFLERNQVGSEVRDNGEGLDSLRGKQRRKLTKDKGSAVRTHGPAMAGDHELSMAPGHVANMLT